MMMMTRRGGHDASKSDGLKMELRARTRFRTPNTHRVGHNGIEVVREKVMVASRLDLGGRIQNRCHVMEIGIVE